MLELLAASVQLCIDKNGFIIFGKKRHQQNLCRDVTLPSENIFSVHLFVDKEEETETLK